MKRMKNFLKKHSTLFIIFFSFSLSLFLFYLCYRYDNKYTSSAVQPINGVLFLDEEELRSHPIHFLVNEWAAYHGRLLTPEDFSGPDIPIPDGYMQVGAGPDSVRTGDTSYSLLLALPPEDAVYTLELPEIYSSYRLYINDSLMVESGLPGADINEQTVQAGSLSFQASGDTRILFSLTNSAYFYGGITSPPAFGKPMDVISFLNRQLVFHSLLIAVAGFQLLFFFLPGIYSSQPRRYLYTGLCLMFIGFSSYNIRNIFPHPLFLFSSVEMFCYYGMFLFILLLTGDLCTLRLPLMKVVFAIGCATCVLALWIPFLGKYAYGISTVLSVYKFGMALVFLLYLCVTIRHGNIQHKSLLAGITIFTAALLADRLWPLFEPIYLGWFPEIAGACLILILGVILLSDTQRTRRRQLLLEEQQARYKRQITMQEQHYETLVEQIERTRKIRHDLRHHMVALSQMLQDGQIGEALDYLRQYEKTLNLSEKMTFSNYYKIDVIIRYFYTLAQENGIPITVTVSIPEKLHIPETDLCIVYGNLLENALESCLNSASEHRYIRMDTMLAHSQIVISMENTLGALPIPCADGYCSTKEEGRKGIGLASVLAVARQYGGDARFEQAGSDIFFSQVLLINRAQGEEALPGPA